MGCFFLKNTFIYIYTVIYKYLVYRHIVYYIYILCIYASIYNNVHNSRDFQDIMSRNGRARFFVLIYNILYYIVTASRSRWSILRWMCQVVFCYPQICPLTPFLAIWPSAFRRNGSGGMG